MAMLDGQTSTSFPAKSELVGVGARRKNVFQPDHSFQNKEEYQNNLVPMTRDLATTWLDGYPKNDFKRRERRHVYHDIVPLKDQVKRDKDVEKDTKHDSYTPSCSSEVKILNRSSLKSKRNMSVKPAIPPKPKYILRDKRLRHVYQTIDLPSGTKSTIPPPPLPDKPLRLQRRKDGEAPPPLPPRVVNEEAVKQRHKLDQEYFENLRKSVDEHLLDIAEEDDLPVPIQHNTSANMQDTRRHNFGAHSPPLNVNPRLSVEQTLERASRRHSLPLYESIQDIDNSISPPDRPSLLARTLSNDNDTASNTASASVVLANEGDECGGDCKQSPQARLAQNLYLLKRCGWYWGNMTWQEAESLLAQKDGEGVFLMRDSQNPLHLLTVTVRSTTNTVHHIRVEYSEGKFQLYEPGRTVSRSAAQCVRHSNIEQFIKLAIKHSVSGSFLYFLKPKNMGEPPVQIRLLTPISRLSKVKSLQYLCRMTIRNCVVAELVPHIPVPQKIQQYLISGPYYDPGEDL